MRSNSNDELERLLEEGLAAYSRQEPRPGLEERVLYRIRSETAARKAWFPRWAWAMTAMAGIVLAAVVWMHRPRPSVPRETPRVAVRTPAPVVADRPKIAEPVRRARVPLPRRREFPAPAKLTDQERALLLLASDTSDASKDARETLLSTRQQDLKPIQISEIRIPPLQIDGLR